MVKKPNFYLRPDLKILSVGVSPPLPGGGGGILLGMPMALLRLRTALGHLRCCSPRPTDGL